MNKVLKSVLFLVLLLLALLILQVIKPDTAISKDYKFKFDKSLSLSGNNSVVYSKFKGTFAPLNELIDIEVIDIDLNNKNNVIVPAISDKVDTVENLAKENNAIAAINGGFFDVRNGLTVSYIMLDGKVIGDPNDNENLLSNPCIHQFLKAIMNRAELRVLQCGQKLKYQIAFHNDKPEKNCKILHLLQGGPRLIPDLNMDKEAFLVFKNGKKIKESANVSKPDARIAVGLTPNNHMIWVMARAGYNDTKYYGLTIEQLAKLLKYFNVSSALAYDGGSSTTMYVKLPDGKSETSIGDVNTKGERYPARVRSILLIKKGHENE